ncbi:DUF3631 domain-containing protein [Tunturiibacter gelidoferens]|uniref:DUF3631 domain-containing protein n=1 Tax=Tunturiibacter gelidiferens TaxID=3069689 RepID=A0A9X0U579_9BACT|nr:DUF3631 domain-containing protein [Edaphobacter lichenicola]MBB5328522.1 hypothetical protein [Edaphobacter lichenicola]
MIEQSQLSTENLLNKCREWLRKYVMINRAQETVLAVWIVHTWAIEAADYTPYLHITAPEKGCGRSRLLEVLESVVSKPCKTGGMTAPALVRTVDKEKPTLLLDEIDVVFQGNKEMAEVVRGILNEGFRRGGNFPKCSGANFDLQEFRVFCAKAIAGIGEIPDTVASRSIVISMRRKGASQTVQRFREREVKSPANEIERALEEWATAVIVEELRNARPLFPECLTDRQQDISESLLAIADYAGGEWPMETRTALEILFSSTESRDNSIGVQLLLDIRDVFEEGSISKIFSADLASALCEMEGHPWADFKGSEMDAQSLARELKKYHITPHGTIRIGTDTRKGYERDAFIQSWDSYCPRVANGVTGVTGVTIVTNPLLRQDSHETHDLSQ